jgi:hypothetical protein
MFDVGGGTTVQDVHLGVELCVGWRGVVNKYESQGEAKERNGGKERQGERQGEEKEKKDGMKE